MNIKKISFQNLRRPEIGSVTLSVIVALYLALFMNRTFWSKIYSHFHHDILMVSVAGVIVCAVFMVLAVAVSVKYLTKPVFILLVLVASTVSWFTDQFGIIVDGEMIRNILETTAAEARGLISRSFILYLLLTGILPAVLIAFVRVRHRNWWPKVGFNLAVIVPLLVIAVIATFSISRQLMSTMRQHSTTARLINPVSPIISAIRYAGANLDRRPVMIAPLGRDARVVRPSYPGRRPRVLIVVAGETARASSFSLGGYARETNPELARRDVLYFSNTTSCGTSTAQSIPCMFSVYPRQEYSHRKGRSTETLPDVLGHAGIHVEWWENNTGSKGVADRIRTEVFYGRQSPRFCIDEECQDGIMLDRIGPWLDDVRADSVLFIHQLGSHGPAYFKRYPDEFRRFLPDCRGTEFNACSLDEIRNAYDNTILYTDYFLSRIIDALAARSGKLDGAMIYMSDHGESLGEGGLFLHGTPFMVAPAHQTHIPFVLWMSPDFAKTAGVSDACLRKDADMPFSHDNLFPSVLSLMNVETTAKDRRLDMLARCRNGGRAEKHVENRKIMPAARKKH